MSTIKGIARYCLILYVMCTSLVLSDDHIILDQPFTIETNDEQLADLKLDQELFEIPNLYEPDAIHDKLTVTANAVDNYYAKDVICGLFLEKKKITSAANKTP